MYLDLGQSGIFNDKKDVAEARAVPCNRGEARCARVTATCRSSSMSLNDALTAHVAEEYGRIRRHDGGSTTEEAQLCPLGMRVIGKIQANKYLIF